ncbi:GNAT family N-acetyltransferase [Metabacillus idriensis]|uniref:GNAT family N-acetyltransferase n=1 Tax=Metabacillus idriensis TaxID=324768 RepID=UPI002813CE73|nr:GNAT family N-acetyltransferase [Metabacillus idriensis]MDR0139984.1 GNAT family N-acetyltransferase [Metabacillus idriensis]
MNTSFPVLYTERFVLRKMEESDAGEVFAYFSEDEVTRYYDLESFTEVDQAVEIINRWSERFYHNEGFRWGIADRQTNKIIGSCGYHNWEKEHFKAEIGFEVNPSHFRKGVMTEVLSPILKFGFTQMNLNRIEAFYDPDNTASKLCLEKAGFIYEGVLRQAAYEKGVFCDAAVCSILKEEYMKEHSV